MYFYDAQHEKENPSEIFPEIRIVVVELMMQIMEDNPYVVFFLGHYNIWMLEKVLGF